MKVLFLGRYCSTQPPVGGNTIYQRGLAHHISSMADTYYVGYEGIDFSKKLHINKYRANRIKVYDIVNSPLYDYPNADPRLHIKCPPLHNLFFSAYREIKPDIIHAHDLFLPITVYEEIDCPIVQTIHNYVHVCPQVYLYYKGKERCFDYNGGEKCTHCRDIPALNESYYLNMKTRYTLFKYRMPMLVNLIERYYRLFTPAKTVAGIARQQGNGGTPQPGQQFVRAEGYRERRERMLNVMKKRFSLFHCSSNYTKEYLLSFGIEKEKIRVIPITSAHINRIRPKEIRGSEYPVRFGYFGGNIENKGINVVIEAFKRLNSDKARLFLFGNDLDLPEIASENIICLPAHENIRKCFGAIDIGLMPSIWIETFGLLGVELNNARIPVIASNAGGVTEWLKEGVNGYGIRPGNVDELVEKMKMFIEDPSLIAQLQLKMRPWKNFREHAMEIYSLYENITKKG